MTLSLPVSFLPLSIVDWGDNFTGIYESTLPVVHTYYATAGFHSVSISRHFRVSLQLARQHAQPCGYCELGRGPLHGQSFGLRICGLYEPPNICRSQPSTCVFTQCHIARTLASSQMNQPINFTNTDQVADVTAMFLGATGFNQSVTFETTINVISMIDMFFGASSFNQLWNLIHKMSSI